MSEYLDVMHDKTEDIRDAAYGLQTLARAFYATGNETMGQVLGAHSRQLMEASKAINDAVGKEINRQCDASQQSAHNTVTACLAMGAIKSGS